MGNSISLISHNGVKTETPKYGGIIIRDTQPEADRAIIGAWRLIDDGLYTDC